MEVFIITLFNATGGARLGNITAAILQITRNDDPIYFAGWMLLVLSVEYIYYPKEIFLTDQIIEMS